MAVEVLLPIVAECEFVIILDLYVVSPAGSPHARENVMRKIRLSIDDLAVESFKTAGSDQKNAGTVHAHFTEVEGCAISKGTCFQSCARTNGYQYCIDPYC
jgi:hypothetical protein